MIITTFIRWTLLIAFWLEIINALVEYVFSENKKKNSPYDPVYKCYERFKKINK